MNENPSEEEPFKARAKVTKGYRFTLPRALRQELGLQPHDDVEFVIELGRVTIEKVPGRPESSTAGDIGMSPPEKTSTN